MYLLDAGRLNKRISIYGYTEADSGLGSVRTVLTKKASVWAEMYPVRGTEFLEYYREANQLQYKITIRYRSDITEKDVLVRGDRQFSIQSIIDVNEDHVALEIYCTEKKDRVILSEEEEADE